MQQFEADTTVSGQVIALVQNIIRSARTGDYAATASTLNRFLALLQKVLAAGTVNVNLLQDIAYSVETLSHMQQMQNWVAFADLLEYEFLPLWNRFCSSAPPAT